MSEGNNADVDIHIDPNQVLKLLTEATTATAGQGHPAATMAAAVTLLAAAEMILSGWLGSTLARRVRKQMRGDARQFGIRLNRSVEAAVEAQAEARH